MPTYDYRCKTCEARFELSQSFTEKTLTRCPKSNGPAACISPGKGEVAKVFAAPGITFKGSGFYKTDAGSSAKSTNGKESPNEKESSSDKSAPSSDTKSGSTSDSKTDKKKDSSKVATSSGSSTGSSDS